MVIRFLCVLILAINLSKSYADGTINVESVDLQYELNAARHKTARYGIADKNLVLRRGDWFDFKIKLNEDFKRKNDRIKLEFVFGSRVMDDKSNLIVVPVKDNKEYIKPNNNWDAAIMDQDGKTMTISAGIPANAAVGIWKLSVTIKQFGLKAEGRKELDNKIYILFNPWCKDDDVFLDNEDHRLEYVMNDVGKVYMGSVNSQAGRKWFYGQFEDDILPAVMYLMSRGQMKFEDRGDLVKMTRMASSLVNSNDNNGVITGNWGSDFSDGLPPTAWTGSAAILSQYFQTGEPVRYGQCWVFGGVLTTVCRALGIPARTITTFASAHDTDDSLTIDNYADKNGRRLNMGSDSIWNFHVWSEAWFARPNYPTGFGGWQAIDATPQEISDGLWQAGPASVHGIKLGLINYEYDMHFIFSEVNSDVITWVKDEDSPYGWVKVDQDTYQVAPKMFTKAVGQIDETSDDGLEDVEDITLNYKYKDGTDQNRAAIKKAAQIIGVEFLIDDKKKKINPDVEIKLLEIKKTMIGNSVDVVLRIKNKSTNNLTLSTYFNVNSISYRGVLGNSVKSSQIDVVLNPDEERIVNVTINEEDYIDKLMDYSFLKITTMVRVKQTDYIWIDATDLYFDKPRLELSNGLVTGPVKLGQNLTLEMSFTNPITRNLTDCFVSLEGPGITGFKRVSIPDVPEKGVMKKVVTLTPSRTGKNYISAIFHSNQLIDVYGSLYVEVEPNS